MLRFGTNYFLSNWPVVCALFISFPHNSLKIHEDALFTAVYINSYNLNVHIINIFYHHAVHFEVMSCILNSCFICSFKVLYIQAKTRKRLSNIILPIHYCPNRLQVVVSILVDYWCTIFGIFLLSSRRRGQLWRNVIPLA